MMLTLLVVLLAAAAIAMILIVVIERRRARPRGWFKCRHCSWFFNHRGGFSIAPPQTELEIQPGLCPRCQRHKISG